METSKEPTSGRARRSRWIRWPLRALVIIVLAILLVRLTACCLLEVPESSSPHALGTARLERIEESSLTVLVWNIHKGKDQPWAETFPRFAADADLLIVQEAWLSDGVPEILQFRGEIGWQMGESWIARSGGVATGPATGSPAIPLESTRVLRSRAREPFIATPKTALITRYTLAGREEPLLVANVHGLIFTPAARVAEELSRISEALSAHAGPAIVAGDFNTWTEARLDVLRAFVARNRLEAVFRLEDPFDGDRRTLSFGHPLDHAFVRDLRVTNAEVLQTDASDHQALRFEVSF